MCKHSLDDMKTASYNGLCPICLNESVKLLQERIRILEEGIKKSLEASYEVYKVFLLGNRK